MSIPQTILSRIYVKSLILLLPGARRAPLAHALEQAAAGVPGRQTDGTPA